MKELKLERYVDSKKSRHALAGANLRKELKHRFPKTKFKVLTESYSGGSSLNVFWIDGEKEDTIKPIVNKYVYGHFDGMTDMYEYDKDSTDEFGEVKYGFTSRSYSKHSLEDAIENTGADVVINHSDYSGFSINGDYLEECRAYAYLQGKDYGDQIS